MMKPVKSFVDTFKSDVCFDGPRIWLLAGCLYKGFKKKKKIIMTLLPPPPKQLQLLNADTTVGVIG